MNIDYNYLKNKCIEWHAAEGGRYAPKACSENSYFNLTKNNYLGDKINRSKFQKDDITKIPHGKYSEDRYIFFITEKTYNPKAGLFQSSWNYEGFVLKVESDEVMYVAALPSIPQKDLKRLEPKKLKGLEHRI